MISVGAIFGRLRVLHRSDTHRRAHYVCACECGKQVCVRGDALRTSNTRSCGCLHSDTLATAKLASVLYPQEYHTWLGILYRCTDPNSPIFCNYGGRGITVDSSWLSFDSFLSDMGRRPSPKHSIDRTDNNAGYGPLNCTWATPTQQQANRRNTIKVAVAGEFLTLNEISERYGISRNTTWSRIEKGWSGTKLLQPPRKKRRSKTDVE